MREGRGKARDPHEAVIGLEMHAQLMTRSKLFCPCSTTFGSAPNTQVCPVCLGQPGALPRPNGEAVRLAVRLALALGSRLAPVSVWARKHYFYPDLPKGYQITQYQMPLALGGRLRFRTKGRIREIRLERIHLEEDAGRSVHAEDGRPDRTAEPLVTGIDCNRCGTPLAEIVTRPFPGRPEEAAAALGEVRRLLRYLEVGDGNMEEGSLRCDANLSLRPRGSEQLGVKVEIKNLNSIRFVEHALEYEGRRQADLLDSGRPVPAETRLWDPAAGCTRPLRRKEDSPDYRHMPEPDLPPLVLSREFVEEQAGLLPELPLEVEDRLAACFGLTRETASMLARSRERAAFFQAAVRGLEDPRRGAEWIRGEFLGRLRHLGLPEDPPDVPAQAVGRLLRMRESGRLTDALARKTLDLLLLQGGDPEEIAASRGWTVLTDPRALDEMAREAIARRLDEWARENPGE